MNILTPAELSDRYIGMPKIKCSPCFVLLCIICLFSGSSSFVMYAAGIFSHECAHCAAAYMLGCQVSAIELLPYGCRADIDDISSPADELLIAMAGPIFSLAEYTAAAASGLTALQGFGEANLYIALMNLLPVYPLDGGRAVRCMADMAGVRLPQGAMRFIGAVIAAALILAGCLSANPTAITFGVFLLLAPQKKESGVLRCLRACGAKTKTRIDPRRFR